MRSTITVLMQSIGYAVMAFFGVGVLLQYFLIAAASIAGLNGLRSNLLDADTAFMVFAGLFWLSSQVIMIKMIVKNRGVPDIGSREGDSQWFKVFVPIIYLIFIGFAFIVISSVGFFVAGIASLFLKEWLAVIVGLIPMSVMVVWIGYYFWTARKDPSPWEPGYKEWILAKNADKKQSNA